jgi:hypothetical protein
VTVIESDTRQVQDRSPCLFIDHCRLLIEVIVEGDSYSDVQIGSKICPTYYFSALEWHPGVKEFSTFGSRQKSRT